jgi:hypothetical protein
MLNSKSVTEEPRFQFSVNKNSVEEGNNVFFTKHILEQNYHIVDK